MNDDELDQLVESMQGSVLTFAHSVHSSNLKFAALVKQYSDDIYLLRAVAVKSKTVSLPGVGSVWKANDDSCIYYLGELYQKQQGASK